MNLQEEFLMMQKASHGLAAFGEEKINTVLLDLASTLTDGTDEILAANGKDCARMDKADPRYDRLLLTADRLAAMASDLKTVAGLPCPLGEVLEEKTLSNGLNLKKVRVPLGVVAVIYEARPNVTVDVFALCFKSGNACILKSGSDAEESAEALVRVIHAVLEKNGIDPKVLFLMPPEREHTMALLKAHGLVDVIIPRGGKGLIDFVVENASVPVIETGAGIVHTYVDSEVDVEKAAAVIFNAKTRRPSVCNALDTLIVHEAQLKNLAVLVKPLEGGLTATGVAAGVEIFADEKSYEALKGVYSPLAPAQEEHFGTEFLSLKMSIKTVESVEEAVAHIGKYGSKHSEAILSENAAHIEFFLNTVDAAIVYANTSTGFGDGAQFGLGAEIGISTQKLHARGPMALKELTSYKWLVRGDGQTRV